jgi:hypothetical protein
MKATETFKATITKHLEMLSEKDSLFAETFKKPNKNIDDCITYILGEVQKSGMNGFADEEIYNMAVHYYDEDDIKAGKPFTGRVVVNHQVEISPEEIEEAKQKALSKIQEEQRQKLTAKATKKKVETQEAQPSLF